MALEEIGGLRGIYLRQQPLKRVVYRVLRRPDSNASFVVLVQQIREKRFHPVDLFKGCKRLRCELGLSDLQPLCLCPRLPYAIPFPPEIDHPERAEKTRCSRDAPVSCDAGKTIRHKANRIDEDHKNEEAATNQHEASPV